VKSWWDSLPERLVIAGLDPTMANRLRQDFREFAVAFRGDLPVLPSDWQVAAWAIFERVFLTSP